MDREKLLKKHNAELQMIVSDLGDDAKGGKHELIDSILSHKKEDVSKACTKASEKYKKFVDNKRADEDEYRKRITNVLV